jgi:ABC-type sugar transport system substrate-binding protein
MYVRARHTLAAASLAVVAALVGCGSEDNASTSQTSASGGAAKTARTVTVDGRKNDSDATKQLNQVENAIQSGRYNAISIGAVDPQLECKLITEKAAAADILVVSELLPDCGRASESGEALRAPGTLAFVAPRRRSSSARRRSTPRPPRSSKPTPTRRSSARRSPTSRPCAAAALRAAGELEGVRIYEVGGNKWDADALRSGELVATARARPATAARAIVQTIVAARAGKQVPRVVLSDGAPMPEGATASGLVVVTRDEASSFTPEF